MMHHARQLGERQTADGDTTEKKPGFLEKPCFCWQIVFLPLALDELSAESDESVSLLRPSPHS